MQNQGIDDDNYVIWETVKVVAIGKRLKAEN